MNRQGQCWSYGLPVTDRAPLAEMLDCGGVYRREKCKPFISFDVAAGHLSPVFHTNSLIPCDRCLLIPCNRTMKLLSLRETGHVESKNLYGILKTSPAAISKDVKRAYRKLPQELHPDQVTSPEVKKQEHQKFPRTQNGYVTLRDPQDGAQYDRELEGKVRWFAGQTRSKLPMDELPRIDFVVT